MSGFYCKRGDCELYIKELENGLGADRMSCANFAANQFRLFMHAAAYVLLLETNIFFSEVVSCHTLPFPPSVKK